MNRVTLPRILAILASICATSLGSAEAQSTAELFRGTAASLPTAQGWAYYTNPFFGAAGHQNVTPNGVGLNTLPNMNEQAGYFSRDPIFPSVHHPQMPILDRSSGFVLGLGAQVLEEQHIFRDDNGDGKSDRAGFSWIVLAQDHWGVEIGFWHDQIWVYEGDARGAIHRFTQAESVEFDTTQLTEYRLQIVDDKYFLRSDTQILLHGPLRNYQFFSGLLDVYEIPSFVFWGDDTSSAASRTVVSRLAITTGVRVDGCDFNLDGGVDGVDLAAVFASWGNFSGGDLNNDSITDGADAGLCFSHWTGDAMADTALFHGTPEPSADSPWGAILVTKVLGTTGRSKRRKRNTA